MNTALPAGETNAPGRIDEEDIRLTTGFADIFTAILLVVGGTLLGSISGLLVVAAAFALGKPLVRTRRFAACGNVLAVGTFIGAAMPLVFNGSFGLLVAALASYGFWRVHRVPMALALSWIGVTGFVIGLSDGWKTIEAITRHSGTGPSLIAGAALFAAAMWYDSRDRLRQTRLSDVAFWLHLASAPLFVHGLFAALGSNPFTHGNVNPAVVLGTFFVLTLVSLAIDRRPLLASSFIYLVTATGSLIRDSYQTAQVGERELQAAMAPAVIGVLLLVLAAAWTPLRRMILAPLPQAVTRLLPPAARHVAAAPDAPADLPEAEKEPVRLVLGFNDFFVALGAGALFVGSIFIGVQLAMVMLGGGAQIREQDVMQSGSIWLPIVLPALAMWLVAEYFVRVRRMAWPAITAAFGFSFMACAAGILAAVRLALTSRPELLQPQFGMGRREVLSSDLAVQCIAIAIAVPLIANLLFWWRHRVPVSFALAAASLVPLLFADWIIHSMTGGSARSGSPEYVQLRLLAAGLIAFMLAMLWDRADTARQTQRADVAFWLHLLASGLAIPALYMLANDVDHTGLLAGAGFLGLVVLALVIDRRAPLAVALPFAIAAIGKMFDDGSAIAANLALILALLALVLKWDQVRGRLIGLRGSAAVS